MGGHNYEYYNTDYTRNWEDETIKAKVPLIKELISDYSKKDLKLLFLRVKKALKIKYLWRIKS